MCFYLFRHSPFFFGTFGPKEKKKPLYVYLQTDRILGITLNTYLYITNQNNEIMTLVTFTTQYGYDQNYNKVVHLYGPMGDKIDTLTLPKGAPNSWGLIVRMYLKESKLELLGCPNQLEDETQTTYICKVVD